MLLGALLGLAGACAKRATAYRFRAPVVSSVRARPAPRAPVLASAAAPGSGRVATNAAGGAPADVADLPAPHRARPVAPPASSAANAGPGTNPDARQDNARRPASARTDSAASVADQLRARVGERDRKSTDLDFARALLASLGVTLTEPVRTAATGPDLLAVATERKALTTDAPLAGDLVVFEWVDGEAGASLVGVAVGVVARAHLTVEFVFLARGVVRRGYVTPSQPDRKRDEQGRALNTFVRALRGKARKSDPFLAGQLFRTFVRVDRLSE